MRRSMEMPVIRCSDSARFVSGNLPMSSAAIASTTPTAGRLMSIEVWRVARQPAQNTCYYLFFQLFGLRLARDWRCRRLLRERRVDHDHAADDGEQRSALSR